MENKTDKIVQNIKTQKSKKTENILYNEEYFLNAEPLHVLIQNKITDLKIRQVDLINKIDLDKQNGYKYLNGKKTLKRDLLIKILIALGYNFDDIQKILKTYQYPALYPKIKRDHIILSAILNESDIKQINEILALNNETLL